MPNFDINVNLHAQGVTSEVDRIVGRVQTALQQLRGAGYSGVELGRRTADIEVGAAAGVEQLRRQGAPQTALRDAQRQIEQLLTQFGSSLDVIRRLGRTGGEQLLDPAAIERQSRSLADLYGPRGRRGELRADAAAESRVLNERTAVDAVAAQAEVAVARRQEAARIEARTQAELAASGDYIEATVAARRAREAVALRQRAGAVGVTAAPGESDDDLRVRTLTQERIATLNRRLAEERAILNNEGGLATLINEEKELQRRINRALAHELVERERAAGIRGTRFQRVQQGVAQRRGEDVRSVLDFPTMPQFLGSKALTTAGFALSGAVLYGAINGVQEMVRSAEELEKVFNQIERQFVAVNEAGQFPEFRRSMLAIARETGETAATVAFVGFQMKGAFGGTAEAIEQTTSAIRIARVTGLELNEIVDSLTGTAKSFGVNISDVGDAALGVQERMGVLSKETIKAVADIGPVASEAGLSLRETTALLGVAQLRSARGGAAIAEAFGRIVPSIQGVSVEIVKLYSQTPALQERLAEVASAAGQGETGKILVRLIRDWDLLSQSQRNYVTELLGGRREASTLNAIFGDTARVIEELDRRQSDHGKTLDYFNDLQETLTQNLARAREEFVQIGDALFRAGLGEALSQAARAGGDLLRVVNVLLGVLGDINEVTGGWAFRVLEVVAAIRLLNRVAQSAALTRVMGVGAIGAGGGGAAAGGAAGLLEAGLLARLMGGARGLRPTVIRPGVDPLSAAVAGTALRRSALPIAAAFAANEAGSAIGDRIGDLFENAPRGRPDYRARTSAFGLWRHNEGTEAWQREIAEYYRKQLEGAPDERLDEIARKDGPGFFSLEKISTRENREARREAARRLLGERRREAGIGDEEDIVNAAREVGQVSSERADELLKDLRDGKYDAFGAIAELAERSQRENPEFLGALRDLQDRRTRDARRAAVTSGESLRSAETSKQLFESGLASLGEYLRSLEGEIGAYEEVERQGPLQEEQQKELGSLRKQHADLLSRLARESFDLAAELADVAGTGTPEGRLTGLVNLIRSGRLSPEDRIQAARDVVGISRDLVEERLSLATSAEEQLRIINEGVAIPEEARVEIVRAQVEQLNPVWARFLETYISGIAGLSSTFTGSLASLVAAGQVPAAAALALLQAERAALEAQLTEALNEGGLSGDRSAEAIRQQIAAIDAAIAAAQQQAPGLNEGVGAPGQANLSPTEQARRAYEVRRQQLEVYQSQRELSAARAQGDPVRQATLELEAAEEAERVARSAPESPTREAEINRALVGVLRAQAGVRAARVEAAEASRDVERARASSNAMRLAQLELAAADAAAREAQGPIEEVRALAQRIRAERTMQEAMQDLFAAQQELIASVAEAAGDTVTVARTRLEVALDALRRGRSGGAGEAELLRLQAEVNRAEANLRDTDLNARQRDIDVALRLERITVQQAIAQLRALLQIPNLTKDQIDEILLKIKDLQNAVSGDLQFSIPSEIRLPTLYEVRRMAQTPAGTGYQDNREINVQLYVNNGMDQQQASQWLSDTMGLSGRQFGTAPRGY